MDFYPLAKLLVVKTQAKSRRRDTESPVKFFPSQSYFILC
jgi:hypothetical protein